MQRGALESISIWDAIEENEQLPVLKGRIEADVCIVGAGIAGLTAAYLLQKEGLSVAIADAWGIAKGETGRTTIHLTAMLDTRYYTLEALHGEENCRHLVSSHLSAIQRIEAIIREEHIDCQFMRVDGYLVAANPQDEEELKREMEAVNRAGLSDAALMTRLPLEEYRWNAAIRIPNQACMHATRYMQGLAQAFLRKGGQIFVNSPIKEVHGGEDAHVISEEGGRIDAGAIFIATGAPVNDRVVMHTKQVPSRTYAIAVEMAKDAVPPMLIWDTETPYHYVRMLKGREKDCLIVGGEDHQTGRPAHADERYGRLEQWTRERFLQAGAVTHRWSGQVLEPVDHIAYIGRNPMDDDNVYIATGTSGNGTTYGTIAGMLICDLIQDRENPWAELYNPARKPPLEYESVKEYAKFNSHVLEHMADHLKGGKVASVEAIRPGEGAVMRRGVHKVAVYRDEQGKLHERSAVCTHLGCVVKWNAGEKSWDCPCHGSRFSPDGRVLNGPAPRALAEVSPELHAKSA